MDSQVSIIKCKSYGQNEVFAAVKKATDLIGGIAAFVKKGDRVLIKPNLLAAQPPESGIDTHPEFVRAVVRLVKQTNAEIILGDSPSVWGRPQEIDLVYETSGIKAVAKEEGVNLIKLDRSMMVDGYSLTTLIKDCNRIISLPKFKTHDLMVLTGAIKNLFGLVPGLFKTELHRRAINSESFAKVLVDILGLAKPTLTIIDGIVAMEGDGPATAGTPRNMGLVLAGNDCVSLDAVLATIMGLNPKDILSTKEASERGMGEAKLENIEILGERIEDVIAQDFKLPQTSIVNRLPKPMLKILKGLTRIYPAIDNDLCKMCQACVKSCPANAITNKAEQLRIEYSRCILCFCCQEVCPYAAVKIKKNVFTRIISGVMRVYSHYRMGKKICKDNKSAKTSF